MKTYFQVMFLLISVASIAVTLLGATVAGPICFVLATGFHAVLFSASEVLDALRPEVSRPPSPSASRPRP